jgi:uncharacterized protein YyaL (SSP411 family)
VDWLLNPVTHLVIAGAAGDPTASKMHDLALQAGIPRRVIQRFVPDSNRESALPPAMAGMLKAARGATAYCCTGTSCRPPAHTLAEWEAILLQPNGRD